MHRRQVEFGKAIVKHNLNQEGNTIHYFGFVQEGYKDAVAAIRDMVYKRWDGLPTSPPKTRPSAEKDAASSPPALQILSWQTQEGRPKFPDSLVTRYDEGTDEHAVIAQKKAEFDDMFPPAETRGHPTSAPGRVGGACDFAFDNSQPLDIFRVVSLEMTDSLDPSLRPSPWNHVFKSFMFVQSL